MRITCARSTDGRVFRPMGEGYHVTRENPRPTPSNEDEAPGGKRSRAVPHPGGKIDDEDEGGRGRVSVPATVPRSLARILRPQAAYRWLLPQIAAITPQSIESILRGALAGSHVQQWE